MNLNTSNNYSNSFKTSIDYYSTLYPEAELYNNPISVEILDICRFEYMEFLNKANVVGIALGYKHTNGINTRQLSISVLVSKKLPLNLLNSKDIIPPLYKNIKTDVIETGIFEAYSFKDKIRPVPGGYDIGPSTFQSAGTMGYLVKDRLNTYILSCNHVLIDMGVSIGTPVLQPSLLNGGVYPQDIIASIHKYIPIEFVESSTTPNPPENQVDCAIAQVYDLSLVTASLAKYGKLSTKVPLVWLEDAVAKCGSTTECSAGWVNFLGGTVMVKYNDKFALFTLLIISNCFTRRGDSGAILFKSFLGQPVGLFFAGTNSYNVSNPLNLVLESLDVSLV